MLPMHRTTSKQASFSNGGGVFVDMQELYWKEVHEMVENIIMTASPPPPLLVLHLLHLFSRKTDMLVGCEIPPPPFLPAFWVIFEDSHNRLHMKRTHEIQFQRA